MDNMKLFGERLARVNAAINLQEPDRLPVTPMNGGLPFFIYGKGSYQDLYYNPEICEEPIIRFHDEFEPDAMLTSIYISGKACEIAQANMIDWPGRPGSIVDRMSTYQVYEREYMSADEYDELIADYTGFIINKYMPRAYPGLKGLAGFVFNPSVILGTWPFGAILSPGTAEAFANLQKMAEANNRITASSGRVIAALAEKGFPPLFTGYGEVPFDIISDYFRGTSGMFEDQMECPEKIAEACELFVRVQIAGWQYLKSEMPIKRVFFPMHKGMDGFMNPKQYHELYWEPFQKILKALIDMGATPFIYTEGAYDTRVSYMVERLSELKKGSCIVHFEKGDFAKLKKAFSGVACICGGMPVYTLEWESKEAVADRVKYLIDNCAAGGGYILDCNCVIENAKYENIRQMYETARTYGAK